MNERKREEKLRFAGEKKPSMHRRSDDHDYHGRCFYMVTMAVEGRLPLLGWLVGNDDESEGSPDAPRVELSPLGLAVNKAWSAISSIYPQVAVVAQQVMPDHFHGILYFREATDVHLGQVVKGFKLACNRALRGLLVAMVSQPAREGQDVEGEGQAALRLFAAKSSQPMEKATLWERGYNDRILHNYSTLDKWKAYLRDNPRRLAIKRAHPDFFRVRFGLTVAGQTYAAIGNRFLLNHPLKLQVQCSRRLTEEEIQERVDFFLEQARKGAVLVSPAISPGEQAVMRAAIDAHLPLIFLTPWGFNTFSKPGHQYYEACVAGRFLILAPWEHQNERVPLTRTMCLTLNSMTKAIGGL